MNNTILETQEVENAVVSIHFFPVPGCFLTSPLRSVQVCVIARSWEVYRLTISTEPPITREIQPARTILCVPQSGILVVPIHSCPAWIFLAGFNVEHRRPSRLAMHHHAKQVVLIAAGSGIGSSGDRMQSMISSKVMFTKFAVSSTQASPTSQTLHNYLPAHRRLGVFPRAVQGVADTFSQTLEWVLLESYTDWICRENPFRAPGNEVLRGGQSLVNILFNTADPV
ncbi:hypothetical protein B0H14DRAFT_2631801 [Mycena olivaceomarginata]|nr:hypothetical protein B0H14DRAFT_2631801 [Mycena olivaceomarginata]